MAQYHHFLASDAKLFLTMGHMPMFEQSYENWYIRSQNGLWGPFGPFLGPNWSK